MARLIYALKIFVFRHQFNLTSSEFTGIKQLSIFGIKHYIKSWFTSRLSIEAPKNDLELLKSLANESCSPANKALKKLANHLWYLSEELVALALFAEVESRTQGSRPRPRPRTQKKSEAKAKDSLSEDRHSRGQGQECSRPRPRTKDTKRKCSPKKKKKKGLHKNFSSNLHEKTLSKKFFNRSTKF